MRTQRYHSVKVLPNVRVAPFVEDLRIAYRPGTIDERVIATDLATVDLDRADRRVRPDDVVLDVGAHIGTFALRIGKRVPDGRVFAIEASRDSYELLVRNVALNNMARISTDRFAMSDRAGSIRLHHDHENWGHTIMKPVTARGEAVPTVTLGQYLDDRGIERCNLAKLNCEGAEFPILMAASDADLRRIERLVVFYHLDLVDERFSLDALEQRLAASGFETEVSSPLPLRGHIVARRHLG
jgi:FkbM family methyltransferase